MYARLLQSFSLLKPLPFLTIDCKLAFRRASHISESNQQPMDWTNSCPTFSLTQMCITIRKICCYFSFIMLLNTIVLNDFRMSRATLDYICQALRAWPKIASVSSLLFTLKSHYEKSDAYLVYFHMWKRPRMEWSYSFTLSSKNRSASHIRGKKHCSVNVVLFLLSLTICRSPSEQWPCLTVTVCFCAEMKCSLEFSPSQWSGSLQSSCLLCLVLQRN